MSILHFVAIIFLISPVFQFKRHHFGIIIFLLSFYTFIINNDNYYLYSISSYSKEENLDHLSPELQKFTHLIREAPCSSFSKTHDVISLIDGYSKINLKSMRDIFQVEFVTKLCILQRRAT